LPYGPIIRERGTAEQYEINSTLRSEVTLDVTVGITDGEYVLIGPQRPAETERGGHPSGNNRRFSDGVR